MTQQLRAIDSCVAIFEVVLQCYCIHVAHIDGDCILGPVSIQTGWAVTKL